MTLVATRPANSLAKEGHAVTQQEAVHLPARDHRVIAEHHLMHDKRIETGNERQADQHQRTHPDELVAFVLQEGRAVGIRQPVDDIAEELEQRHFADGDRRRQNGHECKPSCRRLRIVPAEGKKAFRGSNGLLARKGIKSLLEPAKHENRSGISAFRPRLRARTGACKHIWEPEAQGARP